MCLACPAPIFFSIDTWRVEKEHTLTPLTVPVLVLFCTCPWNQSSRSELLDFTHTASPG